MAGLIKHFYNGFKKEKLIHPEYAELSDEDINRYINNVCFPTSIVEQKVVTKMENNTMWYNVGRRIPILIAGYLLGSLIVGIIIIKIIYALLTYK